VNEPSPEPRSRAITLRPRDPKNDSVSHQNASLACNSRNGASPGKSTRGVELSSVDDLDKRQAASWMKQAAAMPFFGARKR
jgi:hypothetical protein